MLLMTRVDPKYNSFFLPCLELYQFAWFSVLSLLQAEEQLKLVEEQRKVLEERQAREKLERQKQDQEQAMILNKKDKKRPKLSFSLGPK